MTRQRGASRGFESKKNNQNRRFAPSEAPSKTITQATQLATPTTDSLLLSAQEGLHADFLQQGDEALAALRDRARGALAGLQRSFAAVRLQRALRRGVAMRRYVEMLRTSRARRVQEVDEQGELEGIGLRKQQLFQAVEGLQDAAGEWLVARAGQLDEDEPAWLVRAGQELEQMLQQWQQRQEERLDGRQKTQQRDLEGTPPSVGRQGRRAADDATSPVAFGGFGKAVRVEAPFPPSRKQGGGRQRKERIAQNATARDAAAGRGSGPKVAHAQSEDAQAAQVEQDRMERQVRAEVMEARQLAAAMQASREQAGVGNQVWGATEGDDDIDEQFRELCDAAGVAPEDVYRPAPQQPRAVEEAVFKRKCWRAGVTVACGGQRERLRRLHVARARSELFMRNKLGANWRRVAERNLEAARARYAARQWLATAAQVEGGRSGGGTGR